MNLTGITRAEIDPKRIMGRRDVVLAALRKRGSAGLHSLEIRTACASGNPSERIRELRAEGFEITTKREPMGDTNGVRYTLVGEPDVEGGGDAVALAAPSAAPLSAEPASLFEIPTGPRHATFDDDAEAA